MRVSVVRYKRRRNGKRQVVMRHKRRNVSHRGKRGYRSVGFHSETLEGLRIAIYSGMGVFGLIIRAAFGAVWTITYVAAVLIGLLFGTKAGRRVVRRTKRRVSGKATRAIRQKTSFTRTGRQRLMDRMK